MLSFWRSWSRKTSDSVRDGMNKRWSSEMLPVQLQKMLIPITSADEPLVSLSNAICNDSTLRLQLAILFQFAIENLKQSSDIQFLRIRFLCERIFDTRIAFALRSPTAEFPFDFSR